MPSALVAVPCILYSLLRILNPRFTKRLPFMSVANPSIAASAFVDAI